jgi:hypothetical protein
MTRDGEVSLPLSNITAPLTWSTYRLDRLEAWERPVALSAVVVEGYFVVMEAFG